MKRGEALTGIFIAVISAAAVALIFFPWFFETMDAGDDEVEECRLSVQFLGTFWLNNPDAFELATGTGEVRPRGLELNCQTRHVRFTEEELLLNGKPMEFYDPLREEVRDSYTELTVDIVNSVVASEMATCWYQFQEGTLAFRNHEDLWRNNRRCFPCSEIRFDDIQIATASSPEPFTHFLRHEQSWPYPPKTALREQNLTYEEYLYLQDHLCDASSYVKEPGQFRYNPLDPRSCEQQLYEYYVYNVEPREKPSDYDDDDWKDWEHLYKLPYAINPEYDYVVIFQQIGEEYEELPSSETKTGTSYFVTTIPTWKFGPKTCGVAIA